MKKNNSKTKVIAVISILAFVAVTLVATVGSAGNDPLVTLSYLNQTVIPKITEDVKNAVLEALGKDDITENSGTTTDPTTPETTNPTQTPDTSDEEKPEIDISTLKYTVVFLKNGEKLFASGENTESTEIVLRAGKVNCISPFHDQGIADLTASQQLYNDEPLVINNYCIIPRGGDGRGIYAVDGDAYILVRGEYEIVQS